MAAFVGRERELAALVAALAEPPAVAVVEGEAGIGKTRLVAELREHAALAERRFVVGACPRIREPFPLGPVIEAVGGLGGELARVSLSPVAGALRPLLPELAPLLPPVPEPLDDRVAERHRVFRGLAELLAAVSPVVLVLEDLHWADEHTLDFVSYLLSAPPPELSLLVTFRDDEVAPGVRAVTAKLPSQVAHAYVALERFDAQETAAFAGSILGLDRVSERFATYLCTRASGVPLVIEELLALLEARGSLVRRDGSWARRAIDELDVPAGVRDPLLERFTRLDEDARAAVEAAAVLQVPVRLPVLVATARAPAKQALRGVELAVESGLLLEDGGAFGFRHVLAAQAIYETIPAPRRQQLHHRAVAALDGLDSVPLGQRAHHLRNAGRLEAWVEAAEQAADRAVELGHDDEAARLLEDVLRHAPLDAEQRGRLAVKLGRAAGRTLHPAQDVVDLLSEVLEHELPRVVRGELRLRLAFLLERFGADFRRQRPLYAAAAEDLQGRPELQAHAMVALGVPGVPEVPLAEHKSWLHRVLETISDPAAIKDPMVKVFLLGKVAMVLTSVGDPDWRRVTERIINQTGGFPRQHREVNAYGSVGLEACYAGHLHTADRLLTAGLDGAVACESDQLEQRIRSGLALLDFCRGGWDGLAERADVLIDELAGNAPSRADVEVVAGALALARGDLDRAAHSLEEVTQRLTQRGAFDLLPLPAAAMTRLAVSRGDVAGALAGVRALCTGVESMPFEVSAVRALPVMTEALGAGDQHGEARALVTRWARQLDGLDAPLASAALPHARGVLASATGRWPSSARHLLAAATEYERLGCPYEAAQAREQAALALLRTGESDAGGAAARAAMLTFQRLGATWDLDRASGVARHHGVSVPARHRGGRRGYGTELSPREREVAELAAGGRTNKQIADELFTSVNTVKKHLSAAMRKLSVGSRTELAYLLAGDRERPLGR